MPAPTICLARTKRRCRRLCHRSRGGPSPAFNARASSAARSASVSVVLPSCPAGRSSGVVVVFVHAPWRSGWPHGVRFGAPRDADELPDTLWAETATDTSVQTRPMATARAFASQGLSNRCHRCRLGSRMRHRPRAIVSQAIVRRPSDCARIPSMYVRCDSHRPAKPSRGFVGTRLTLLTRSRFHPLCSVAAYCELCCAPCGHS